MRFRVKLWRFRFTVNASNLTSNMFKHALIIIKADSVKMKTIPHNNIDSVSQPQVSSSELPCSVYDTSWYAKAYFSLNAIIPSGNNTVSKLNNFTVNKRICIYNIYIYTFKYFRLQLLPILCARSVNDLFVRGARLRVKSLNLRISTLWSLPECIY